MRSTVLLVACVALSVFIGMTATNSPDDGNSATPMPGAPAAPVIAGSPVIESAKELLPQPLVERAHWHGLPCQDDCSGHRAGYRWAERRSIQDPDECTGNSHSFIEGCQAYANELAEMTRAEDADEEDEEDE